MSQTEDHIKPLRLFDIARGSGQPITNEEKKHITDCAECQRIIEVFARQFDKLSQNPPAKAKSNDAA